MPDALIPCEPLRQLWDAGYGGYLLGCDMTDRTVRGRADVGMVIALREDPRFQCGVGYGLHRDVGTDLADFRAFEGTFGPGSLQIVIDQTTGQFYADCDKFSPYEDARGFFGHLLVEVLPNWVRGWTRRG